MLKKRLRYQVIPALAGMTFFFISCQVRVPVTEPPGEAFQQAETYRRTGELAKALRTYRAYFEQEPRGPHAPLALHRMAEIYAELEQYPQAQGLLRKIARQYPGYRHITRVELERAHLRYQMGDYRRSMELARAWVLHHPNDPNRAEAYELLGDGADALNDPAQAFWWWTAAKELWMGNLKQEARLNEKLEQLIQNSGIEELERIAPYAEGSEYAPELHHRMALLFLEVGEFEKAKASAMSLVRATPEQYWVSAGREILELIREALSVRTDAIGCLLPLSGPFGIYGEEVLRGAELGMGLFRNMDDGDPIQELVIRDSRGEPEAALVALEELAKVEKVVGILGPLSSRTASAVARKADELNIPVITLTQQEGVTQAGDMVFRNFLTPAREVERLVSASVGELGIKRFAVMYPESSYGRFLMTLFSKKVTEMGARVTAVESYGTEETDFADQIKKMTGQHYPRRRSRDQHTWEEEEAMIRSEEPEPIIDFDAVFIPDDFEKVAMIAPQLVYHNVLDVQLLGTSLWQSDRLMELAGDYVQGAVFTSGFFEQAGTPEVREFVMDYQDAFKVSPGILAASGYDTVKLLRATLSSTDVHTRRGLREELLENAHYRGITGDLSFDSRGEIEKNPFLLTVKGDRLALFHLGP